MTNLDQKERARKSMLGINTGIASNTFLAIVKTIVGIVGNSPALLADGINSTSDVAYGVVVNVFMRLSAKPADEDHPYGHDRLESIAAVVVGAFVMATAISIFWASINDIYELFRGKIEKPASHLAFFIALFSIVLKTWLSVWTRHLGKKTNNCVLLALAADHRNDIFASSAACLGILFSWYGQLWVDPLAGAIVAIIIFLTGLGIIKDATADLMNTIPGDALTTQIKETLKEIPQVIDVEEISGHRFGVYMVIDLVIGVHPDLTVYEGNKVATLVENRLINEINTIRRVFVHYHPAKKFREQ